MKPSEKNSDTTRIKLGEWNKLHIVKEVEFGLYLDGGAEGEILLPSRYVPTEWEIEQLLDVFLYLDSEERLVATTQTPLVKVNEFAHLEVAWVNEFGAFLNWGLMKDLFVPFREQKMRMQQGRSYVVHVHIDEATYRIVASAKIERYLSEEMPPYESDDEVEILVWQKTDLGFKAIIDQQYSGVIYDNEIFRPIRTGDKMKAYIKQVRPDGKIDLSLQKWGATAKVTFAKTLLRYLEERGGYSSIGDKTNAEDIYAEFGVSKKVFKKAVGDLYRKRLIAISDEGIRLLKGK